MAERDIVSIADLTPDPENARQHNPRNIGMIRNALGEVGAARSIVIDEDGRILAGNGVIEAAADAGIERVQIVDADGETIIAVRRRGLTPKQKKRLAYFDNRAGDLSGWDPIQIAIDTENGFDFEGLFSDKELAGITGGAADLFLLEEADAMRDDMLIEPWQVPNARWPTDNEWDVPTLDIQVQPTCVEVPFEPWGSKARGHTMTGTYHFYVDDYRFEALWKDPTPIVNAKCAAVVEPNYTVSLESPRAWVLWNIYRKRWLARYWQTFGIRIWVDLNVPAEFAALTFLGVPRERRAYMTRGYAGRIQATENEYAMACEHHGDEDIVFAVYGGGRAVREHCDERGWTWVPEEADRVRGRIDG